MTVMVEPWKTRCLAGEAEAEGRGERERESDGGRGNGTTQMKIIGEGTHLQLGGLLRLIPSYCHNIELPDPQG